MNVVNLGDKYQRRITLRLSDEQMSFLGKVSKLMGVSPSEYIRMTINVAMVSAGDGLDKMANGKVLEINGGHVNENVKANSNNIV